jgi:hypothetical protein
MTIKLNVAASYKCVYSFFLKINMQAVQKKKNDLRDRSTLELSY